jgi:hypothetical protein
LTPELTPDRRKRLLDQPLAAELHGQPPSSPVGVTSMRTARATSSTAFESAEAALATGDARISIERKAAPMVAARRLDRRGAGTSKPELRLTHTARMGHWSERVVELAAA